MLPLKAEEPIVCLKKKARLKSPRRIKEVNSVLYRPIWSVYTVPVSAPVQVHPLFRTGKNISRTGKIWLFRQVKMFRTGTNKKKNKKEKEEEDENKWERERKR